MLGAGFGRDNYNEFGGLWSHKTGTGKNDEMRGGSSEEGGTGLGAGKKSVMAPIAVVFE